METPSLDTEIGQCCHGGFESLTHPDSSKHENLWLKLGVALVLAGQGMVFGLGLNTADPAPEYGSITYLLLHGGLILSSLIVFLLLGPALIGETYRSIRQKRITIDALFLLSISGAFIGSLIASIAGQGSVYYEVVAILLAIYTLSKLISSRSRTKALRAVEQLREEFSWAWVLTDSGERRRVPVSLLSPINSRISVREGEPITVDGRVVAGTGYVRETSMTGEPTPVVRRSGDSVLAGTYSVDGHFTIKPSAILGERKLDTILSTVEGAGAHSSRIQENADRLMRWFLPLVVSLSAATFIIWLALPYVVWWEALFNSMAVLLVACPCAIGLATPIAIWGGLMKLAESGLVSRTGNFIDQLAKTDLIYFDKTGTLSEDCMTLIDFIAAENFEHRRTWLKSMVQVIENELSHPVAKVFQREEFVDEKSDFELSHLDVVAGKGVEAVVEVGNGISFKCEMGSLSFMPVDTQCQFNRLLKERKSQEAKKYIYILP